MKPETSRAATVAGNRPPLPSDFAASETPHLSIAAADRYRDPSPSEHERVTAAVVAARRAYDLAHRLNREVGSEVCGDPAWMMLLDLFMTSMAGKRLSVTSLCIGSRAPSSTALRYLMLLCKDGLAERIADQRDGRRSHVLLTAAGLRAMLDILAPEITPTMGDQA